MNQRQRGFSLIEVAITVCIIAFLGGIVVPPIFDHLQTAKVNSAVDQAKSVLRICDIARKKVVGSYRDSTTHQVTNTYMSMPGWSQTAVLAGQLSAGYSLPATNPFGNPILVRYDANQCYVAVDLSFRQDGIGGYEYQTVGGITRLIISSREKNGAGSEWVGLQKRMIQDESTR